MADNKLTEQEENSVKADLLSFIHSVASGEFNKPEHITNFVPAIVLLDQLFN